MNIDKEPTDTIVRGIVCLLTALFVTVTSGVAAADELGPGKGSALSGQQLNAKYVGSDESDESVRTETHEPSIEQADSQAEIETPKTAKKQRTKYEVRYETMCQITPGQGDCTTFSENVCPNGAPLILRTITSLSGRTVATDSYCTAEPEPSLPANSTDEIADVREAIEQQRVVEVTPDRFQSFPILASRVITQPKSFSLRNGNAHMYAVPNPQTFDVEIFDQPVRVRAIPTSYLWSYGDGQSRQLQQPGKPDPGHTFDELTDTSHVYKETGDFEIRLSTAYRGEYSVNGGTWLPIPGTANVPSEPMPMSVWRTKKLLVDQTCAEDPNGPACDSPFLSEDSPSQ